MGVALTITICTQNAELSTVNIIVHTIGFRDNSIDIINCISLYIISLAIWCYWFEIQLRPLLYEFDRRNQEYFERN